MGDNELTERIKKGGLWGGVVCKDQSKNKNKEGNRRRKRGINDSKGMTKKRGVEIGI